jgi:hypothetical protein
MSQHDYNIANADGASVRADINSVLEAIASQNSGSTAPTVTFPLIPWFDTANNLLKIRNSGNTDWVTIASLSGTTWIPYRAGTALPAFGSSIDNLLQIVGVGSPAVAGLPAIDGSQLTGINSKIIQIVSTQTGAVATGTTTIPVDDTIPQNTEGDEYMTLAITPTSATNKLRIDVTAVLSSTEATQVATALFQDSTASAIASSVFYNFVNGASFTVTFSHVMDAGTTSATTFKVRAGGGTANTLTFNGLAGARYYGGSLVSSIRITEYTP